MKIITSDGVYVQKKDIAFLPHSMNLPIPESILLKANGNGIVITEDNKYEFFKFQEKEEIEYFKNLDWIIDYNEIKDLSEENIKKWIKNIEKNIQTIATEFNSMTKEERKGNRKTVAEYDLLEFKLDSLRELFWFKQGYLPMELPENIDYTKDYVQEKERKKLLEK